MLNHVWSGEEIYKTILGQVKRYTFLHKNHCITYHFQEKLRIFFKKTLHQPFYTFACWAQATEENLTIYTLLYVWKQYFQLLKYKSFFLKTGNLTVNCLLKPYVLLNNYPHHFIKYEGKETLKIPIFKLFSELKKN